VFCVSTLNISELAYFSSCTVSEKKSLHWGQWEESPIGRFFHYSPRAVMISSAIYFLILPSSRTVIMFTVLLVNLTCDKSCKREEPTANMAREEWDCRQKGRVSVVVIPSMRLLTLASRNLTHAHTLVFCIVRAELSEDMYIKFQHYCQGSDSVPAVHF